MTEQQKLTLGRVWRLGAESLRQAGVEEADADAELLLLYVLGMSKTALLRDWHDPWPEDKSAQWQEALERKKQGEPVQYIVGEQYFYGRAFAVNEAVLIPRPETELLAEAVLQEVDRLWNGSAGGLRTLKGGTEMWSNASPDSPVVLDVGTGSGTLAVTLAAERPSWQLFALDLSEAALLVAKHNADVHEVSSRITFVQGDLLGPFVGEGSNYPAIDVLVSNPPYIPSSDIDGLQREVRDHEPHLALDGGDDGLNPYRIMAQQLGELATLPRIVAFEVGAGQAEDVAELLRSVTNWGEIRFVKDYAGIDRHVIAVR
ncbi:MAG: peptide chain release factor N(5)-glutamine methyltransferase [Candidatus Cohnella colombiensis]|uniref:Release factor glutamine methyltransferase n=1 Tax=Candidatus Cohnella colombiensis TaxID=3121368 RepID=A0AA95EW62_9BACL|nr:MAG: peptide chain release factor N(5)-glutamine methyltransferase [Cohnella sp.]